VERERRDPEAAPFPVGTRQAAWTRNDPVAVRMVPVAVRIVPVAVVIGGNWLSVKRRGARAATVSLDTNVPRRRPIAVPV
jgi:hypothetical protein